MSTTLRVLAFITLATIVLSQDASSTTDEGVAKNDCPEGHRLIGPASRRVYACDLWQKYIEVDGKGYCCEQSCSAGQALAHRPMNGVCPAAQDPLAVFCCYTDEEFKDALETACPPGQKLNEAVPLRHRGCPAGHKSYHSYCCYEDVSVEPTASTIDELNSSTSVELTTLNNRELTDSTDGESSGSTSA